MNKIKMDTKKTNTLNPVEEIPKAKKTMKKTETKKQKKLDIPDISQEDQVHGNLKVHEVIQRNNKFYLINRSDDEAREVFLGRVDYIIKTLDNKPEMSFDEVLGSSYVWRNINFYGMTYPRSVMRHMNLITASPSPIVKKKMTSLIKID
jgi:hypothetical protein